MAFITMDEESRKKVSEDKGGANVISESGIYSLTIKHASVSTTKNGATQVDFNFEGNDGVVTCYGMYISGKDGAPTFGMTTLKSLMTILSLDGLSDPEPEEFTFGSKKVTLNVIPELADQEVKVKLQLEHGVWQNKVSSQLKVRRFYRASDGKTGSEIVNEVDSKQLATDMKYATKDKYNDGLTADDVANKSSGTPAAETPVDNPFAQ